MPVWRICDCNCDRTKIVIMSGEKIDETEIEKHLSRALFLDHAHQEIQVFLPPGVLYTCLQKRKTEGRIRSASIKTQAFVNLESVRITVESTRCRYLYKAFLSSHVVPSFVPQLLLLFFCPFGSLIGTAGSMPF